MKNKIFFLPLFFQLFLTAGCGATQNQDADKNINENKNPGKTHYHVIGESEGMGSLRKKLIQGDPINDLIDEGAIYYEQGKYDLAIKRLKKVLENASASNKWVAKGILGRAYEAKGEYVLALKEINWQIEQKPRQEVIDKLLTRKQNLEKLLAQKKNSSS